MLELDKAVDLLSFRLTRLGDTFKVQRGVHAVTAASNVMEADPPSKHGDDPDFTPDTSTEAEEWAVRGTVVNALSSTSAVIAQKNGTDRKLAAERAQTYYKPETPRKDPTAGGSPATGGHVDATTSPHGKENVGVNKSTVSETDGNGSVALPAQDDL